MEFILAVGVSFVLIFPVRPNGVQALRINRRDIIQLNFEVSRGRLVDWARFVSQEVQVFVPLAEGELDTCIMCRRCLLTGSAVAIHLEG